ncbi:bis(5'-nucleosyl)-tetraphosphatase (symmetrical) YqeK [Paenibacillus turicensis]|uniref:bis(5'-nucleosyl)-tetraphosphatase (symmetrical) YqeK n=1 Tax=Paenibacillus turicensis TaxID=160487 RepID=UPI003D2AFC78
MGYTRDELIQIVSSQMPAKRWKHVEGVMSSAVLLSQRYGADPVKADMAALLHDLAKYWPIEKQEAVIKENNLNQELLLYDKQLLHGEVGAFIAQRDYGITESEILDAVKYHTSGRVNMTLMDKIICLADYIEPGRDFPGVNNIRALAETSLDEALIAGLDSTITFLIEQRKVIYPITLLARNDLVQALNK